MNCLSGATRRGLLLVRGAGELVLPARSDGYLTTAESARLVGVQPVTIRQWRKRGWLVAQGLDERGYPLHTPGAVRAAEALVRANGLEATRGLVDPRRLRKRTVRPEAA